MPTLGEYSPSLLCNPPSVDFVNVSMVCGEAVRGHAQIPRMNGRSTVAPVERENVTFFSML